MNRITWIGVMVGFVTFGAILTAQKAPKLPLQFLKSQSVILIELDPNGEHETVTINGPAIALDSWICTRYEHGKSCKRASEVAMFILQDGVEK